MPFVVYAMRHRPSGKFYIGSTLDLELRTTQWRLAFARAPAWAGKGGEWRSETGISRKLFDTSTTFDDYEFLTLELLPAEATPDDAAHAENRAIIWAAKLTPELLLNTFAATWRSDAVGYRTYRMKMPRAA